MKIFYIKEGVAANMLLYYGSQYLKFEEMKSYQDKYIYMIKLYKDFEPISSFSYVKIDMVPKFREWLPELKENKAKFMPLIISNMLLGDIMSLSIYEALINHYWNNHETLEKEWGPYEGTDFSRAMLAAKHWLTTEEAANIFSTNEEGRDTLCYVTELLGVNSEFVDCN